MPVMRRGASRLIGTCRETGADAHGLSGIGGTAHYATLYAAYEQAFNSGALD